MLAAHQMYDTVRIDHFRGFDTYWQIPASEPTAVIGEWVEGPSYDLFDELYKKIDDLSILAEDLGELMYVFQFHYHYDFDFDKVVVYSGTHDNDTLVGWLTSLDEEEYEQVETLLEDYQEEKMYQKIIHYCLDLKANDVIIPVWDMMGCDSSCRFNVPGKIGSPNWEYRLTSFEEFDSYLQVYQSMVEQSQRKEG